MHVVHLVHSPDRISRVEACTAPYTNTREFSGSITHGYKAPVVKHLSILVASDVYVNIGDGSDAKTFVNRVEPPIWYGSSYLLRAHSTHRFTVRTKHIEAAV